jgi:hypothetical protein
MYCQVPSELVTDSLLVRRLHSGRAFAEGRSLAKAQLVSKNGGPKFELVSMSAAKLLLPLFQLTQMRVLKFR